MEPLNLDTPKSGHLVSYIKSGHLVSYIESGHLVSYIKSGHLVSYIKSGHLVSYIESGHLVSYNIIKGILFCLNAVQICVPDIRTSPGTLF